MLIHYVQKLLKDLKWRQFWESHFASIHNNFEVLKSKECLITQKCPEHWIIETQIYIFYLNLYNSSPHFHRMDTVEEEQWTQEQICSACTYLLI